MKIIKVNGKNVFSNNIEIDMENLKELYYYFGIALLEAFRGKIGP